MKISKLYTKNNLVYPHLLMFKLYLIDYEILYVTNPSNAGATFAKAQGCKMPVQNSYSKISANPDLATVHIYFKSFYLFLNTFNTV